MGIWPEGADGTDTNALSRSHSRTLVAIADDFGGVKIFRYPCIVKRANHVRFIGHSSHVTNVCWTFDDSMVVTCGGGDCSVFHWKFTMEYRPDSQTNAIEPMEE